MTGRPATTAALYAGFLALWALGDAVRRREPSPYLLLGGALLQAALLGGAVVGASGLGDGGQDPAVHAGYLAASVVLLPLGLLLARDRDGRLAPAPLSVALLALAIVVLRAKATA
ncbi:MAG: hypothetical protein JST53_19510 [Actinobacteria bacterium]|nr:hypothetical protein [Actinomycetota bacterium]